MIIMKKNEYNRICSTGMDNTMRRYLIKMVSMVMSMIMSLIGPAYAYFAHGIRTTWTSNRIPFTEPNSDAEFIVNIFLQTIILGHGCVGYFALEMMMTLVENVVTVTPRLCTNDLAQTIGLYKNKQISELELRCKMNHFMKSTCDTDK